MSDRDGAVRLAKLAIERDAELEAIEAKTGAYAGRQHLPALLARALLDAVAEVERLKATKLTPLETGYLKEIRFCLHKYGRVDVETEHIDVLDKLIAAHGAKP